MSMQNVLILELQAALIHQTRAARNAEALLSANAALQQTVAALEAQIDDAAAAVTPELAELIKQMCQQAQRMDEMLAPT